MAGEIFNSVEVSLKSGPGLPVKVYPGLKAVKMSLIEGHTYKNPLIYAK